MTGRRAGRLCALVGMLLLSSGGLARGGEYYYALVYGSQDHPKHFKNSHTWATFVKATGEGPDPNAYALEAHTISWVPASLDVRVLAVRPEPGANLTLDQTFAMTHAAGATVTLWGPFRIQQAAWLKSLEIRDRLNSGAELYRAIDGPINELISDCIHAVAAVDPTFGRAHYPLIRIGKPASRYIARQVLKRSAFDQTAEDHSWLIPRLGLGRYPMTVVSPRELANLPPLPPPAPRTF